ncbi:MAG TPA: DJ-1/PfpI family protein [Acidimicrobiales bacterium]|nr:DJ-1/PfpI family protein [Acidimicrobiales bacterium]
MPATAFAIALFPGVEELDWVGPWEVLSGWAGRWPEDQVSAFTVADTDGVITCARGARVLADHTWATAPPFDVLVWPGGPGTRPLLGDEGVRKRVRSASEAGAVLASVCTGALVLADAGLLDHRPATTYWSSFDDLRRLAPGVDARPDERYVDDGDVVTAAGVSAGIDMALHLVRRFHSVERAREVRRLIQYDPQPPV